MTTPFSRFKRIIQKHENTYGAADRRKGILRPFWSNTYGCISIEVVKKFDPKKVHMGAWRLKSRAIFTKSPFGDCIVMVHGAQSTEVDFGTLARDFSHRV